MGDDEELLRDPEVRARYRGRLDPVDVLLWRTDPHALGSNGSRSPAARAADLGPLIYGRADTPERARERDAAAAEAQALMAGWAADSAALDDALATARSAAINPGARQPTTVGPATGGPLRPRKPAASRRPVLLAGAGAAALAVVVTVAVLLQPGHPVDSAAAPSNSPRPTATPTSTPTRTSIPPPAYTAPPPMVVDPTVPPPDDFRREYYEDNIVTILQVPIDGGPIDNANGTADVDPYGVPLSYVVANGDVFELIAKRFDLATTYLAGINAVRRDNPTELFVGDTINLGATTILRIGDQNGVVYHHTDRLPDPHLPQD